MKQALRNHWQRILVALVSGAAATLAFAPVNLWLFALLSPALFWLVLQPLTPRQAFWHGWAYGSGFFGAGVSWVFVSIHRYGGASLALATLLTALFCIGLGLLFAIQASLNQRLLRGRPQAWLGFAGIWVIFEWIRSWIFTGFPWLYLGYSDLQTPLQSWAPIGGVWLLSLFTIVLASALAEGVRRYRQQLGWKKSLWPLLLSFLPVVVSLVLPQNWTRPMGEPLTTTLIQPNIAQLEKWQRGSQRTIIDREILQSVSAPATDLLIWPETAIPAFYQQVDRALAPFISYLQQRNTTLITGILTAQAAPELPRGARYFNSVMAFDQMPQTYRKQHLVPFGEYVPFEQELRGLIAFFDLPMSEFSLPLKKQDNLQVKGISIAPAICYEIAFPELVRKQALDAEVILTLSNDTWFGRSLGPAQHLQIAQMRAVENGRWVIRATNNGYSALINATGGIEATLPVDKARVLHANVQPMQGHTPYQRLGLWPGVGGAALLLLLALGLRSRKTGSA